MATKLTPLRIPTELLERIDASATELGTTRTAWMLLAAEERLESVAEGGEDYAQDLKGLREIVTPPAPAAHAVELQAGAVPDLGPRFGPHFKCPNGCACYPSEPRRCLVCNAQCVPATS